MAQITIENLSFRYSLGNKNSLEKHHFKENSNRDIFFFMKNWKF